MSLLDAIEPDTQARDIVREAAWRRMQYLMERARWRVEQVDEAPSADSTLPDRALWATATLWMEAIETALFIDEASKARELLPEAIHVLDLLGHPLGSALQHAFMPSRATRADTRVPSPYELTPSVSVWAEFSEWPWFVLPKRRPRVGSLRIPVGRMGVPLADVLRVARWRATERDDTGEDHEGTAAVLQRLLDQQYTALAQAQQNPHLWHRLLVPAPLFDLELAVLLAAGLTRRGSDHSPASLAAQRLLPEVQAFGSAYLLAVQRLRN